MLCHGGGAPGFSAFFARFLDDEVTVIVLSNDDHFDTKGLAHKISDLMLGHPAPIHKANTVDSAVFRKAVGTYSSIFGTQEVREEGQQLYLHQDTISCMLIPMNDTNFYRADDEDVEVRFEHPDELGMFKRLRIISPFFWFTSEREEKVR